MAPRPPPDDTTKPRDVPPSLPAADPPYDMECGPLSSPTEPPPYSAADAYPAASTSHHHHLYRGRRLRRVFSVPVSLAVLLTLAVSWLCILVEREVYAGPGTGGARHASYPHGGGGRGPGAHAPARSQSSSSAAAHPAGPSAQLARFRAALAKCDALDVAAERVEPAQRRANPRWNNATGQLGAVVLRNARLFDGEAFLEGRVDVLFEKGLITAVSPTEAAASWEEQLLLAGGGKEYDVQGRFVTPGLVDMHSHHMVGIWPALDGADDGNEVDRSAGGFGPLTPFVRAIDGMHPYDQATRIIASGGVTSSLIIPGSANIMGGEGFPVKNRLRPGTSRENVVEDLLLEHGVPHDKRHRYMKMACGENPSRVYTHTRMGNAWILRKHLARAKELNDNQDAWCEGARKIAAAAAGEKGKRTKTLEDDDEEEEEVRRFMSPLTRPGAGGFPEELELESTAAMLRGRVAMHNHCYTELDMFTMLRISHEFGFRVHAFHHAIEAWKVPEMIKEMGENITIATFAEFALYKLEAFFPSLRAGQILTDHGVPVAYKSDHYEDETSAKYLMSQAASGYAFGLSVEKALQAVTSVPAAAIDLDYRVGYARPGYDADLVVWDAHPLSTGATPLQVFIDGVATLDKEKTKVTMGQVFADEIVSPSKHKDDEPARKQEDSAAQVVASWQSYQDEAPLMRRAPPPKVRRQAFCRRASEPGARIVVTGIRKSFIEADHPTLSAWLDKLDVAAANGGGGGRGKNGNFTLVIEAGEVTCFGPEAKCAANEAADAKKQKTTNGGDDDFDDEIRLELAAGHLVPGLTYFAKELGLREIAGESLTGDGVPAVPDDFPSGSPSSSPDSPSSAGAAAAAPPPPPSFLGGTAKGIPHAKYGLDLSGKAFARARIGGVTRAVTAPLNGGSGLVRGVSAAFRTDLLVGDGATRLSQMLPGAHGKTTRGSPWGWGRKKAPGAAGESDGPGVVKGDVALHVQIGDADKEAKGLGSVSAGVAALRRLLQDGTDAKAKEGTGRRGDAGMSAKVAAGEIPLVVYVESLHATQQVIMIKWDFPDVNLVIAGGHATPYVAPELALANISVLLSANRAGPSHWDAKEALVGPPLTRSPASYLSEAGVLYAITVLSDEGDSRVHDLALEAAWAAKYAGLSEQEAVRLVTRNVEAVLRLPPSPDFVVWEGSPLRTGGSPVLSFRLVEESPQQQQRKGGEGQEGTDGSREELGGARFEVATCWPDEADADADDDEYGGF